MTNLKNKTKKILIALISLFVFFAILGCATFNVSATGEKPTISSFQMINGASIRLAQTGESQQTGIANTNGIRFSAELSAQDYTDLSSLGDLSAGTFVMPAKYLEYALISEETCFTGAQQKYTWDDKVVKAGTQDGEVKILHIPGKLFKTKSEIVADTDVYRVNGAVVNLLKENLDRKYIGISYVKVDTGADTYYYFAKTSVDNSRSIVDVSQNILVDNDIIYREQAEKYLDSYLETKDGSVTAKVTEEVYVNSSKGYEMVDTTENEVTLTTALDFTKTYGAIPEKEGYLHIPAKQDKVSSVAKIGEEVKLKYYFDKKIDEVIIFDSSRVTGDEDIFTANGAFVLSNSSSMSSNNTWGYHGDKCLYFSDYYKTVNGICFETPVVLPAPTKTISFMVKNHDSLVGNGTNTNLVVVYSDNQAKQEIGRTTFIPSTVPGDLYEVSLTLSKDITQIGCIKFSADDDGKVGGDRNPMYIDYIHAEYEFTSLLGNNIEIKESGNQELDLGIISTKYSDSEIASGLTITVKELPNGTATPLTANAQGKYVLNATEGTNYEIEYAVSIGGNSASGKFFVLGYIDGWVESFEDASVFSTLTRVGFVDTVSVSGTKSLKGNYDKNGNHTRAIYSTPVELQGTYTTLCVWIYSDNAVSPENPILIGLNSTTEASTAQYCKITSLNAGWNYVEVPERSGKQFNNTINNIVFSSYTLPTSGLIIDRISLK